jgi:hypothetical protein
MFSPHHRGPLKGRASSGSGSVPVRGVISPAISGAPAPMGRSCVPGSHAWVLRVGVLAGAGGLRDRGNVDSNDGGWERGCATAVSGDTGVGRGSWAVGRSFGGPHAVAHRPASSISRGRAPHRFAARAGGSSGARLAALARLQQRIQVEPIQEQSPHPWNTDRAQAPGRDEPEQRADWNPAVGCRGEGADGGLPQLGLGHRHAQREGSGQQRRSKVSTRGRI